ncbi:EF-hand calcium-binding domain-containing protein 4A [Caerostris darwini]|uniref:EF-hand calcium-binding domain-containing protein 4A n=1 Tax=Caerostris darwini TaxID=1538125 RepID=A0AAV4PFM4_9ARAC|nr:EF-hand calcium-binding domain-containing protein 4A [Caerostris darwini]
MRDRGDLRETLQNKARDLFALCDPEGKGYATKTDIEALREEVPLPAGQLHEVFDALDANGDGKLTLNEFTDGFGEKNSTVELCFKIDHVGVFCMGMQA